MTPSLQLLGGSLTAPQDKKKKKKKSYYPRLRRALSRALKSFVMDDCGWTATVVMSWGDSKHFEFKGALAKEEAVKSRRAAFKKMINRAYGAMPIPCDDPKKKPGCFLRFKFEFVESGEKGGVDMPIRVHFEDTYWPPKSVDSGSGEPAMGYNDLDDSSGDETNGVVVPGLPNSNTLNDILKNDGVTVVNLRKAAKGSRAAKARAAIADAAVTVIHEVGHALTLLHPEDRKSDIEGVPISTVDSYGDNMNEHYRANGDAYLQFPPPLYLTAQIMQTFFSLGRIPAVLKNYMKCFGPDCCKSDGGTTPGGTGETPRSKPTSQPRPKGKGGSGETPRPKPTSQPKLKGKGGATGNSGSGKGGTTGQCTGGCGAPGSGAPGSGAPGSGAPGSGAPGSGATGGGTTGGGTTGGGTTGGGTTDRGNEDDWLDLPDPIPVPPKRPEPLWPFGQQNDPCLPPMLIPADDHALNSAVRMWHKIRKKRAAYGKPAPCWENFKTKHGL